MSTVAKLLYEAKPDAYFANARHDIVKMLAENAEARIIELGCGAGGTGEATIAAGKAGYYLGIEIDTPSADIAKSKLTKVINANVEELTTAQLGNGYDALIISEVLEHLVDPWATVSHLVNTLKPGAAVYASSPNVAHWTVIKGLFRGRFEYQPKGLMDRTHLRWFTPDSYRSMFEEAGVKVTVVRPIVPIQGKAGLVDRLTGGRLQHLLMRQIMLIGQKL